MIDRDRWRGGLPIALLCLLGWQVHGLATGTGFRWALALRALEPRAGESESLPVEIVEAIDMVRAGGSTLDGGLRLATSIAADPLLRQRAAEALYPVRLSDQAAIVMARLDDPTVAGCAALRRSAHVGLYDCRFN